MTDGQWLPELKYLESKYNNKRWEFRNKFKRYVRNNPYSDKYTEAELIKDLKELSEIRDKMKQLSKDNNFKNEHNGLYHPKSDDFLFRASNPIW